MLLGKTLAITGVSSGIGKRTAELALSMGANVVGIDLNPPPQPLGAYIKADLATKSGIKDVVAQLPQQIDGLLAIAGVSGKTGAQHTMAVNFYGLRTLAESVAPRIRQGGAVVSIASFAGYGWRSNLERTKKLLTVDFPDAKKLEELGCPNELGYPISKEVLILWTQKAAHQPVFRERGVRVVSVSPGPVETPILTQFREVLGNERVNSDVLRGGRSGTPDDLAPIVLFLASDGARWINGVNVPADGGLEAAENSTQLGF